MALTQPILTRATGAACHNTTPHHARQDRARNSTRNKQSLACVFTHTAAPVAQG